MSAEQEKKHDDAAEEEMPELENQDGPKLNRGEKKCRKALIKIGMKPFNGVTRCTVKRRDGMIFAMNDPEVLISEDGKSFAVFGELKIEDPNTRLQQAEAKQFAESQLAQAQAQASQAAKTAEPSNEAPEDETGVTPGHIDMVIDHTGCTRNEAIRALKAHNDDMINAVMSMTK